MKQFMQSAFAAGVIFFSMSLAQAADRIITGDVVANRSVTLASRIMGRVTAIHAEESDTVAVNEALVELDDSEYQARLKVASAALERALADQAHKQRTLKRLESLGVNSSVSQEAIDIVDDRLRCRRAKFITLIQGIDQTLSHVQVRREVSWIRDNHPALWIQF